MFADEARQYLTYLQGAFFCGSFAVPAHLKGGWNCTWPQTPCMIATFCSNAAQWERVSRQLNGYCVIHGHIIQLKPENTKRYKETRTHKSKELISKAVFSPGASSTYQFRSCKAWCTGEDHLRESKIYIPFQPQKRTSNKFNNLMTSSCASYSFLRSRLESQRWNSFNSFPIVNEASAGVPTPSDSGKTPQLRTSKFARNCDKTGILNLECSCRISWSH